MNEDMIMRWTNIENGIKCLGKERIEEDLDFQKLMNKFQNELITLLAFKLKFNFSNEDILKTARNSIDVCIRKLNEKYCTKEEKTILLELKGFIEDIF